MGLLLGKLSKRLITIFLVLLLLLGSTAYVAWYNLFREVPLVYESVEDHFKYGSIGAENEQGIPYWVWLVLPRLFPEKLPQPGGYTALGITWEPGHETPVGFTKKTIGFPRTAINCATCHTATFRKTADENPTIVPTGPSNKFDLQGYIRFLSDCASDPRFTSGYLLKAIGTEYELSWLDKLLYRFIIIPQTRKELLKQKEDFAWMDVRPNWGDGRIDPFNPVKFRTLGLALDDTIGNSDMMSLWNQKQHGGFALHWDGLETSLTETVQTGAIGDGATRKSIDLAGLERVEQYITQLDSPKFPFTINQSLAAKGKPIFDQSCASCHAFGGERTGSVIPLEEIGTDRHRLDMWTQEAADTYNAYAEGYEWDFNQLRKTDGYVAVSLDGLWLRAPYLHNGSVPSLQDLLEKPEDRTSVFYRGYDVYNPEIVGFIAQGPEAKRQGFKYDTQVVANSNQGHLYGTELSPEEKKELIEYLKTF
ncbi:MAG: c-type cytochrome [Leptolyngbya sp. SIO3F4]|nr:c-type cytochrome [Leptolyngbya sp. SIO3F4]